MTAKKPRFEPIRLKLRGPDGNLYDVRATDARDLTPEQAVEKVLQGLADERRGDEVLREIGMVGTFVNGKVRVRRIKQ